ncbi:unnamed protein product [Polarella glacialis]|uniref:Uncharacterized protein n=1 Tax=Polarella glacialis TaxID=89957 RepID=A0A813J0J5_POLGL|nr:unnamed protein product [Polarella glacialis]
MLRSLSQLSNEVPQPSASRGSTVKHPSSCNLSQLGGMQLHKLQPYATLQRSTPQSETSRCSLTRFCSEALLKLQRLAAQWCSSTSCSLARLSGEAPQAATARNSVAQLLKLHPGAAQWQAAACRGSEAKLLKPHPFAAQRRSSVCPEQLSSSTYSLAWLNGKALLELQPRAIQWHAVPRAASSYDSAVKLLKLQPRAAQWCSSSLQPHAPQPFAAQQ